MINIIETTEELSFPRFSENDKTKEIYIICNESSWNNFDGEELIAQNNKYDIFYFSEMSNESTNWGKIIITPFRRLDSILIKKKDGSIYKKQHIYDEENVKNFTLKIESTELLTIKKSFDNTFYYKPYSPPPEIIPIDKAPSTTRLNNITNYVNKTAESIKSCKSYIAYVINNKGGSATDTETLESLINKLKDIKF